MCKFIGISNERILCKLNKSEILRLYSIVHVAMETTKTSNFTCQSQSFISIFFTCQVSACELQPFSCNDLANDIHSQTAKTVFSHLNVWVFARPSFSSLSRYRLVSISFVSFAFPVCRIAFVQFVGCFILTLYLFNCYFSVPLYFTSAHLFPFTSCRRSRIKFV